MKQYLTKIEFYRTQNGGRVNNLANVNYRPILIVGTNYYHCQITIAPDLLIHPGDIIEIKLNTLDNCCLLPGDEFFLKELEIIAKGQIISEIRT